MHAKQQPPAQLLPVTSDCLAYSSAEGDEEVAGEY